MNPQLMASIQAALGAAVSTNLNSSSAVWDLYEAYVFSIVVRAAQSEGATVQLRDVLGNVPTTFIFRTSPGALSSTKQAYGHAVIKFPGKPALEAHVGVRVSGKSDVLHECDVCVLLQTEAETCRRNATMSNTPSPRCAKVKLAIECKCYSKDLSLGLGREFMGLRADLGVHESHFVTSIASPSIAKLLAHKRLNWHENVTPGSTKDVNQLTSALVKAFRNFKAAK